jgi:hypothetical protein
MGICLKARARHLNVSFPAKLINQHGIHTANKNACTMDLKYDSQVIGVSME